MAIESMTPKVPAFLTPVTVNVKFVLAGSEVSVKVFITIVRVVAEAVQEYPALRRPSVQAPVLMKN